MRKESIIQTYKESLKSFYSRNTNFLFSLYAGYEMMIKDFYLEKPNSPFFKGLDNESPKFIAFVGTRITERHDINMSFIRTTNNSAKHYAFQEEIANALKNKPNQIWQRYFVEMNKLFKLLKEQYQYDLDYTFKAKKKKKPNESTKYISNTIINSDITEKYSDIEKYLNESVNEKPIETSGNSAFDIFKLKKRVSKRPEKVMHHTEYEYIIKQLRYSNSKLKNNITIDSKTGAFTIFDETGRNGIVYLDKTCSIEKHSLRDGRSLLSTTKVFAIYDSGNRLIYWSTFKVNKMYKLLSSVMEWIQEN